ncbi:endo-1,4-beta-xylanase [candidate division KSB1 bacterium]|nr:endo-1,4-beta-xylanase [candidate division KSB1 bacterium]
MKAKNVKKIIIFLSIFIELIQAFLLHAQPSEPTGRRLRTIVEEKFSDQSVIIGATTGSWAFGTYTGEIMDREFSYVTPENDFKQWRIHPDPGTWNAVEPDKWVQHIVDNNQVLRMHCPISPQCSNWAKNDARTAEELETNMREFLKAVCERYNGKSGFEYMDVVNETIVNGKWHHNKPGLDWECPWYKIGVDSDNNQTPLYIKMAFEIAQQYAPDIKLIYNHHGSLSRMDDWQLIAETVNYLRNFGLRVDGIGWQAHIDNGWATPENLNRLRMIIDRAHNNNLEFHITEASVWLRNGVSETLFDEQAATYRAILEVLLEKRSTGKVGWNTWHIDDGHGWKTEYYPSLFDADYTAKPAYYSIQEALENVVPSKVIEPEKKTLIKTFKLDQNYPNPFNPITEIKFVLKKSGHISLVIYNLLGEKIETLLDGYCQADEYSTRWNGYGMPGGIYIYRLQGEYFSETKKMILMQ